MPWKGALGQGLSEGRREAAGRFGKRRSAESAKLEYSGGWQSIRYTKWVDEAVRDISRLHCDIPYVLRQEVVHAVYSTGPRRISYSGKWKRNTCRWARERFSPL